MKQALAMLEEIADEVFSPYDNKLGDAILALRAAIEQAQKPVGWFGYDEKISTWFETNEGEDDSVPLYAGARGWEGLTLEETVGIELSLRKYHDGDRYDLSLSDFARAIEARFKEKNT